MDKIIGTKITCTLPCLGIRRAKILRNFNFHHQQQILQSLKAIDKYRNVHERFGAFCSHACTYHCRRALWVFIEPPWGTFIFFIISKFCTVEKLLLDIEKCMHAYAHCACMHYHSQFVCGASLIPPWYSYQVSEKSDLI